MRRNTSVGRPHYQEVAPFELDVSAARVGGFTNVSFAETHQLTTGGPTTISFRCSRLGSSAMTYTELNMTVFKVG